MLCSQLLHRHVFFRTYKLPILSIFTKYLLKFFFIILDIEPNIHPCLTLIYCHGPVAEWWVLSGCDLLISVWLIPCLAECRRLGRPGPSAHDSGPGTGVSSVLVSWVQGVTHSGLWLSWDKWHHYFIIMTWDQGPGASSVLTPCNNKIQEWENQFHEKLKFSMIEKGRF